MSGEQTCLPVSLPSLDGILGLFSGVRSRHGKGENLDIDIACGPASSIWTHSSALKRPWRRILISGGSGRTEQHVSPRGENPYVSRTHRRWKNLIPRCAPYLCSYVLSAQGPWPGWQETLSIVKKRDIDGLLSTRQTALTPKSCNHINVICITHWQGLDYLPVRVDSCVF